MKTTIIFGLLVLSLILVGCAKPAEITPISSESSVEEQEIAQGLDELDQLDQDSADMDNLSLEELDTISLE
jgi:hypothetical protein